MLKECIPGKRRKKNESKTPLQHSSPTGIVEDGIRRINHGENPSRRRGVVSLSWIQRTGDKKFASLHIDGTVAFWERSASVTNGFGEYRSQGRFDDVFADESKGAEPTRHPLEIFSLQKSGKPFVCACNKNGKVILIDLSKDTFSRDSIVTSFHVYHPPSAPSSYPLVSAMTIEAESNHLACGGKDRETVLWDLVSEKQIWRAKNLPPDRQTLLQPLVWPTTIEFLDEKTVLGTTTNGQILAVGTAHNEVRIYDIRVDASSQRRPVAATPHGLLDHRVTALCQLSPYRLAVGDAAGNLHAVDLRQLGPKEVIRKSIHTKVGTHGRFVGPAGSVQQIVRHGSIPRIAVVSLDRMLRVYDSEKRRQLSCMYLKQRLRCALFGQDVNTDDENDYMVNLDDQDIDQEDIVRDYVNSDVDDESQNSDDESADFDVSDENSVHHDEDDDEEADDDDENGDSTSANQVDSEDEDDEDDESNPDEGVNNLHASKRRRK